MKSATAAALALSMLAAPGFAAPRSPAGRPAPALERFPDPQGVMETLSTTGPVDHRNTFFQVLGTNGRSCATCHAPDQAFGLSAASARSVFRRTHGRDPLFASFDGGNCQGAPAGDRASHSLILNNGLIRIAMPLPANAEFTVSVVHDPYGCAMNFDPQTGQTDIAVYRRPPPATNLGFLSAVMSDGRETIAPLNDGATFLANLVTDLKHQALDATTGHAQASQPPTDEQLTEIVRFELGLYTAQGLDAQAGRLSEGGARGGAMPLAAQSYFPGINDSLGSNPTGAPFDPSAMTLFAAWGTSNETDAGTPRSGFRQAARRAIAEGEKIFDTAPLLITTVRGINDSAALGKPDTVVAHCSTCHDAPNVGDHSLPVPLDIGTSHGTLPSTESDPQIAAGLAELSMPDLPVYLISGCSNPFNPGQPVSFYTSDPGRALITGKCSDLNRIKGPILRGLAARAPYFHNGAAATIAQVVSFYDKRFQMGLTPQQEADLAAFLRAL
jgi:cytochrome c peroxidase